jgi:hypothetical protein
MLVSDPEISTAVVQELGLSIDHQNCVHVVQNPESLKFDNPTAHDLRIDVCKGIHDLRDHGVGQTAILYLGDVTKNARGHWVTVKIVSDEQSYGGLRAMTVNSGWGRASGNSRVTQLLDIYNRAEEVPRPDILPALVNIEDAHALIGLDDVARTAHDRAVGALEYFSDGCRRILTQDTLFFEQQGNVRQSDSCHKVFDAISGYCHQLGIDHIDVPWKGNPARRDQYPTSFKRLDLNTCQTFSDFINWLGQ